MVLFVSSRLRQRRQVKERLVRVLLGQHGYDFGVGDRVYAEFAEGFHRSLLPQTAGSLVVVALFGFGQIAFDVTFACAVFAELPFQQLPFDVPAYAVDVLALLVD